MTGSPPPFGEGLKTILDVLTAVSTAAAAIFSAFSAWMARRSANAARVSADEAHKMRQEEIVPRLVLEKDFLDFEFSWPHPASLNDEPVFLARRHWEDTDPSPPTFSITNFGERPALELEIIFKFDDPNGDLSVPQIFVPMGVNITKMPSVSDQREIDMLQFLLPDGRGSGLPLYTRMTVDLPNCAPGQTRKVDFPIQLRSRLFLRGLQYWERRNDGNPIRDIILTIFIKAYSIDAQLYETQFRFKLFPFFQGQTEPLVVVGHCFELPMYPKSDRRHMSS